jgi:hypothetical protein
MEKSKEYQPEKFTVVDPLARLSPVGVPKGAEKIETVMDFFEVSVRFRSTPVSVPVMPVVKVWAKGWLPKPVVQSVIC